MPKSPLFYDFWILKPLINAVLVINYSENFYFDIVVQVPFNTLFLSPFSQKEYLRSHIICLQIGQVKFTNKSSDNSSSTCFSTLPQLPQVLDQCKANYGQRYVYTHLFYYSPDWYISNNTPIEQKAFGVNSKKVCSFNQ